ncbi:uncharacterized protein LTR77_003920 [Saxophila tyrrhenica]|uniref:BAH domain-containing protein n=1 Tax=Saxophila tyrrhenica TaxID=1690608 RepID=A0AAV9PGK1_9PEZI|nr:hypothetical protein LTR77_003920 [Saxophila tyrrhenica]
MARTKQTSVRKPAAAPLTTHKTVSQSTSPPQSNKAQTGKKVPRAKAEPASTPRSNKASAATAKSPSQPLDLSDDDRQRLKEWLDKSERPFSVATTALSKKRKRQSGEPQPAQTDLYEDRLNVQYEVKPKNSWDSLRRYKKFTVGSESMAVGQVILVKHDDSEEAKIDVGAQWKGKVLEVRALDSEHVYLRVAWLNRPEDLPGGRKAYHGKNELIPTNQMDIIDAMSVNGSVEVMFWNEKDDESSLMNEEQYFWRQTFDYANTKTFSKLRQICVDSAPQNPDEMIVQCGNKECRKWLHVKCIAEAAVEEAASEKKKSKKAKSNSVSTSTKSSTQSSAIAVAEKNDYRAEVFVMGTPNDPKLVPADTTEIAMFLPDGKKLTKALGCLFCGVEIE